MNDNQNKNNLTGDDKPKITTNYLSSESDEGANSVYFHKESHYTPSTQNKPTLDPEPQPTLQQDASSVFSLDRLKDDNAYTGPETVNESTPTTDASNEESRPVEQTYPVRPALGTMDTNASLNLADLGAVTPQPEQPVAHQVNTNDIVNRNNATVSLNDLSNTTTNNSSVPVSNQQPQIQNQNPYQPTTPQPAPAQPNYPFHQQPPVPHQSQPEVIQTKYVKPDKPRRGFGCLGTLMMRIFNCIGCLLFILSLIIIGFIVWTQI